MNKETAINEFIERLENLHEVEYGDFKRKLSNYILRLEQGLQTHDSKSESLFRTMRNKAIYNPSGNIEETRLDTIELAEKLKLIV